MSTITMSSPNESAVASRDMSAADMTESLTAVDRVDPGTVHTETPFPSIAFIGKAGAGKTSSADYLAKEFGYVRRSFASLLKQIAVLLWGEGAERDRSKLQPLGYSIREIDPDVWVNALLRELAPIRSPIAIDDCRFANEFWALRGRDFTIVRIEADEKVRVDRLIAIDKYQGHQQLSHISETALDTIVPDHKIQNNTTRDYLERQLWNIVNRELRRR